MPPVSRNELKPGTALTIAPRPMGEIRRLARPKTEARDVIEMEVLKLERPDGRLAVLQLVCVAVATGTSSGEIAVSRIERSTVVTVASNCPDSATHRMRYWISAFGTEAFRW